MSWLSDLQRLQPLEKDLALIPVGWGHEHKAPMFFGKDHPETAEDWTKEALTVEKLQLWPREPFHAVGARTGLLTGPLLAFDFDGTSAFDLDLYPWAVATWQVHRDNDPFRLKVLFRPTLEQISQLPLLRSRNAFELKAFKAIKKGPQLALKPFLKHSLRLTQ